MTTHSVIYSILGWIMHEGSTSFTRFVCLSDHIRICPCSFAWSELSSFTCKGCGSPIHGTVGVKSPAKDYAMRIKHCFLCIHSFYMVISGIKRLAQGHNCRAGMHMAGVPTEDLRYGSLMSYSLSLIQTDIRYKSFILAMQSNLLSQTGVSPSQCPVVSPCRAVQRTLSLLIS